MKLDISQGFLHPGTPLPFQAEVVLEDQDVNGETVTFDPIRLEGTYFVADDTVRLEGGLKTVAHATCALCLNPVSVPLEVSFAETFRKDANETEDECFRYEGKAVPLEHMALTLVLLNLPMRFVCGEGCRADGELKAWNEDAKTWAEESEATYRPFEQLGQMLENKEKQ